MMRIKILLQIIAIFGLFLAFAENKGWLKDKNRINFVKILEINLECSLTHLGAQKFLHDFVFTNPEYSGIQKEDIDKIIYEGLLTESYNRTHTAQDIVSGNIKLKNTSGKTTRALCSFEELRSWSKEMPFWKWFAWTILAISIFLNIIIFIVEQIMKNAKNV